MSPGGCARVMALTPPTGARYNERPSVTSTATTFHEERKQRTSDGNK